MGELMFETERGRVYRFKAHKILEWMRKNDLLPTGVSNG